MEQIEDPLYFLKVYELVEENQNSPTNKTCRFCGLSEPETKFKKHAHIIPELLGKNASKSIDECDTCNDLFSAYESQLAILFRPYLTMLGVEGKKRIPLFQSRPIEKDYETTTTVEYENDGKRRIFAGNESDIVINEEKKSMSVIFRLQKHKPINVYKALLKIALGLIAENEIQNFKHIIEFIRDKEYYNTPRYYFPFTFITVLTKKFKSPNAALYKSKVEDGPDGYIPEYTLVLTFANLVVQIFIPPSINYLTTHKPNEKTAELNLFHSYIYNVDLEELDTKNANEVVRIKYAYSYVDLSSSENKEYNITLNFSYEDMVKGENIEPPSR